MFAAMRIINYYKYFSFFLIILSISSFFIGFIYGENSAGAGTFDGDFQFSWNNLQTFINNDLNIAIGFTSNLSESLADIPFCDKETYIIGIFTSGTASFGIVI